MDAEWRLLDGSRCPDGPQDGKKSGGEPLEIDRRGREVGLDLHVVEAAPDRAPEPVPSFRLAVGSPRNARDGVDIVADRPRSIARAGDEREAAPDNRAESPPLCCGWCSTLTPPTTRCTGVRRAASSTACMRTLLSSGSRGAIYSMVTSPPEDRFGVWSYRVGTRWHRSRPEARTQLVSGRCPAVSPVRPSIPLACGRHVPD